jgi:hypothetical protein
VRGLLPALPLAADAGVLPATLTRGRLCETVDTPDDDVGDDDDDDGKVDVGLVDAGGPIDSPFCGVAEEDEEEEDEDVVAEDEDGGVVVVVVVEAREGRTTFMRRPEPARRSRRNEAPSKTSTHSVSLSST